MDFVPSIHLQSVLKVHNLASMTKNNKKTVIHWFEKDIEVNFKGRDLDPIAATIKKCAKKDLTLILALGFFLLKYEYKNDRKFI